MADKIQCTPPELTQVAAKSLQDLIPEKSRKVYDFTYQRFLKWADQHKATYYSENVLLAYFDNLSNNQNMKSSTLWSHYSMLKAELNINHNIQLKNYTKLLAFLKRKNAGYKPKRARILSKEQVDNFLHNAPNEKYLATKVILILGVSGACRCDEITNLTVADVEDLGSAILVKIKDAKNYKPRSFTILGDFYMDICRMYMSIRKDIEINRFMLKYQNGKCSKMVMGKHKIGSAPQEIAIFLNLPNSSEYTGHCLRRTSATLLVDNGGDISALKRHGGWRSTAVAESYVEESMENKKQIAMKILAPINNNQPSTSDNLENVDFSNIIEETPSTNNFATPSTNNIATKEAEITGALKFANCKFENCNFIVNTKKE